MTWFSADREEQAQQYMEAVSEHADELPPQSAPLAWFLCRQQGEPVIVLFIGAEDDDSTFSKLKPLLSEWGCPREQSLESVSPTVWQSGLAGIGAGLQSEGLTPVASIIVDQEGVRREP